MAALCVFLTAACSYDYRDHRIPNYLIVLMAVLGAGWRFRSGGPPEMLSCVGGGALLLILLYPFFRIGAVGAGDVKLLAVTAGYFPLEKILYFLFFSLLIAGVISLYRMWKEKSFGRRMEYLRRYLTDTARNGSWRLYPENEEDRSKTGVCMSGPVLLSVLLYLGGIY